MTSKRLRLPALLLLLGFFSVRGPCGAALPEVDDQVLVVFIGGDAHSIRVERFLKPPPALARRPKGAGNNQLQMDDTSGKEKNTAPSQLGPGTFTFVKRLDQATPKLYEAACKGTHLGATKWKNLVLKRGIVQKYSVERVGGVAIETIEIAYESVDVSP